MINKLCNFMFFNHGDCKNRIHELKNIKIDCEKKIKSLEFEVDQLLTQIQELKAINHYQTWLLENRIHELEQEVKICKIDIEELPKKEQS